MKYIGEIYIYLFIFKRWTSQSFSCAQ